MKKITIGRYQNADGTITVDNPYSGWIEGETNADQKWILFIDGDGKPEVFWPQRDEDGGVTGEGIKLGRVPGQFSGVFAMLGVQDDADGWDENGPHNPEVISCFPVWHPGGDPAPGSPYPSDTMRGVVFAVVPGDGDIGDRMRKFLTALNEGWFGVSANSSDGLPEGGVATGG